MTKLPTARKDRMMALETKNAIIKDTTLHVNDRCILDAYIHLEFEGGQKQSFGGYALYLGPNFTNFSPEGPNFAGHFLYNVLQLAGAKNWDDLKGKAIRVKTPNIAGSTIEAIGHITENRWFRPKAEFETLANKTPFKPKAKDNG